MSKALTPSSSWVEKPQSPVAKDIHEWCQEYQRKIEAARRECFLIKHQEEPEETEVGQGEIAMNEASSDLV